MEQSVQRVFMAMDALWHTHYCFSFLFFWIIYCPSPLLPLTITTHNPFATSFKKAPGASTVTEMVYGKFSHPYSN